jgi:hypothetical protein
VCDFGVAGAKAHGIPWIHDTIVGCPDRGQKRAVSFVKEEQALEIVRSAYVLREPAPELSIVRLLSAMVYFSYSITSGKITAEAVDVSRVHGHPPFAGFGDYFEDQVTIAAIGIAGRLDGGLLVILRMGFTAIPADIPTRAILSVPWIRIANDLSPAQTNIVAETAQIDRVHRSQILDRIENLPHAFIEKGNRANLYTYAFWFFHWFW